ncbi:hypothetical protein PCANC_04035 [Puccinia coronata f. sp. avenae]|uniref:RRM domain-containing protein n=1 Tax=Puccinia coronata f. sp. avenae TaxID=200324 RepID=A0A2N5W267_9BASI|nr:hypothetical protein PCANC_04035 [Puccinia coronata f. sp. avenae]
MAISPSSTSTKEQSPQSDHQGKNGRAVDQGSDADHDHDHDHDHPGQDAAPESMKDGHGGEDKSSLHEDHHSAKSRSRRDKDRVHTADDRSRDRDRDRDRHRHRDPHRDSRSRRHRDRSDRDRDSTEKSERLERSDKTIDRSPGKDSDIRSHSSRPSHRRHRSRSHETAERSHTDRSRHRERDRRDRDRDPDRDRNRERDRGDLERDRDRDHDRDRERDRERDGERDRDREREKDRARDRDPKRSHRSRADLDDDRDRQRKRQRSRSRERSREPRSRDVDGRESERQKRFEEADGEDRRRRPADRRSPRYRPYESVGSPPRRSTSPHLTEEEHEMRSVFVSQLSARVGDRELFQFFEQQAGKVRDARLITDRISRRSKGVGYVEFRELESVQKALALTGTKLLGLPVMVQYTEAEKNRQAMANTQPNVPPGFVATAPPPPVPRPYIAPKARGPGPNDPNSYARLYVGSLNFNLTDDDIRQVFQPFGDIEYVDLHRDQITGKSKGYAFVQFKNMHDAKNATEKMNGFQLAGRALRVEIKAQPPAALLNATAPGVTTPVIVPPLLGGNFAVAAAAAAPAPSTYEERLEDPIGGNLNQISRVELMHKLARTEQPTNVPVTDMFRPNIPTATSRSVLLKNMFNPEEETEQGWDVELRDDVKGECEEKYGPVLAIAIEKESTAGDIYITFDSVPSAQKAIAGLNNRWFGGRQITAAFISDALVAAHGGK